VVGDWLPNRQPEQWLVTIGKGWALTNTENTTNKEDKMKKILDTRHYKIMLELLNRIKRKNLSANPRSIDMHIENYERLLEYVQDS
jgi:hypothetical protein